MLISPTWEKQRTEPQAQMDKIVNVPLPSDQATKILRDLQTSCNSPNKTTQMKALQCWEAWVLSQNPDEWKTDSLCHFAMKPLITRKFQPLHRDSDISKLKLNIMWNLLTSLEDKMDMKGPKYILDNFTHSCFTWLSSVDELENDLSLLILKLLMTLFQKGSDVITSSHHLFPSIQLDDVTLGKLFHSVIDKFLCVFDNWNKFQNNQLMVVLWKWFLESCENYHNSVATTVWHRIFKVNQSICSDKSEPFKDKLEVLHTCATKIKTVLAWSKYIVGENCFMTPCEALLRKLSEICSVEDMSELSPQDNTEIFGMSREISQTLALKCIQTCHYDLCIQFLDSLEDFSLRSSLWGSWSGMAMGYREFLLGMNRSELNKEQNKFYRKLRAPTANFELDKLYLNERDMTTVLENIQMLSIGCFCGGKNILFNKTSPQKEQSVQIYGDVDMDVTENESDVKLDVIPATNHFTPLLDLNAGGQMLSVTFDMGKFGVVPRDDVRFKYQKTFHLDFAIVKNIFDGISNVGGAPSLAKAFQNIRFDLIGFPKCQRMLPEGRYISSAPQPEGAVEIPEIMPELEGVALQTTPQRKKRSRFFPNLPAKTHRTRNRIKLEKQARKKPKSFEEVVHQILEKNKLRKSRRSTGEEIDDPVSPKKEDPETTENLPQQKTKTGTPKGTKAKDQDKTPKTPTDGKLDSFFKVLGFSASEKETQTSTKCETPRRRSSKKEKKGSDNWKQTSLKAMMRESESKPTEGTKNRRTQVDKTPDKPKSSPSKETRRSREHSNTIESSQVLSENQNFHDTPRKRLKKSQEKPSDVSEIENVDPATETHAPVLMELDDDSNTTHLKDSPLKVDKQDNPEPDEQQVHHTENCPQSLEPVEKIQVPIQDFSIKQEPESEPEKVLEIAENVGEGPQTNEEEELKSKVKLEVQTRDNGNKEPEEHKLRGKKRLLPSLDTDDMEIKKMKLEDDDGVAPLRENTEGISPSKSNDISNPKGKAVSTSPRLAKASNRIIPTRISRMISLISDSKTSELSKGESPTVQPHSLNVSPKMDPKDRNRRFVGHDRSSRVSKMLASLNMSKGKETEEPTDEDKRPCDSIEGTTPNGNALAAKLISPISSKKRKFIGFDESKNQTVIYRVDTPPSQVLEEWEFIKEEYLNSPDVGGEGEADAEENGFTSTPPSRLWPTKKKSRFCLSDTNFLIVDTVSDTSSHTP